MTYLTPNHHEWGDNLRVVRHEEGVCTLYFVPEGTTGLHLCVRPDGSSVLNTSNGEDWSIEHLLHNAADINARRQLSLFDVAEDDEEELEP